MDGGFNVCPPVGRLEISKNWKLGFENYFLILDSSFVFCFVVGCNRFVCSWFSDEGKGISMIKVVPWFSALSNDTVPPHLSTKYFTTASPRPDPSGSACAALLARKNFEKIFGCSSFGIPMPSSETSMRQNWSCESVRTNTWPPGRLYLMAFETRFLITS